MYLDWCNFSMDFTKEHIRFCADLRKSATDTVAMIRQVLKKAWAILGTSKLTENKKTDEEQSQEHAQHSSWHTKQSIPHTTVTFWATAWKCVKTSHRTLATKELAVASRRCTISHFLFHRGIYDQKQRGCPPPTLNIKLKGRHFDTAEAMEAEPQAVLNSLTDHDSQDAFEKWQRCWEWCIHAEGTT
jgi:hypothetical protein